MAGFYERPESEAAKWCLRLAVVTVPFLLLTILLRRGGAITIEQSFWLVAVAIAMIIASLVFGIRAVLDLWDKGYKGGRATVNGVVLGVLLLAPFGVQFLNAVEHPRLNDVATDVFDPPSFIRNEGAVQDEASVYDDFFARKIVASYPQLVGRRYEAPSERVLISVLEILDNWGWQQVAAINMPQLPDAAAASADGEDKTSNGEEGADGELAGSEAEVLQLQGEGADLIPDILIEVEARTMALKLPSRLAIRLRDEDGSTLVDMRAASDWGPHDFGSNAANIADFLAELDVLLAGLAGER
ncbi:DUF1499 domain-containing protein [Salaquimonas pukyongi]|uniref:DUF1499 domain-containing protein n=1 Tax=Salaquimonas pukyongi TaxID=2712698 RepID=UPI0013BE9A5D|nr:DUF1499 domain-containing protein [Salaquimonas pukyongi]